MRDGRDRFVVSRTHVGFNRNLRNSGRNDGGKPAADLKRQLVGLVVLRLEH